MKEGWDGVSGVSGVNAAQLVYVYISHRTGGGKKVEAQIRSGKGKR